jgi:hypothetical protein
VFYKAGNYKAGFLVTLLLYFNIFHEINTGCGIIEQQFFMKEKLVS